MSRRIVIDPVTRIEGHGKVVITLDEDHRVADAKLHVVEFRGYERFVQGHPYWEAPVLLQRICGICFVSHHLAGAKALDDMVGVGRAITPTAEKVRRLGHYAQMLQSHTAAFFLLSAPEMLFGVDAPPEVRNVVGLVEADRALVTRVVLLRKWGQEILQTLYGKRMHGINSVPGGVQKGLTVAERDRFLRGEDGLPSMDAVLDQAQDALRLFADFHERAPRDGRRVRAGADAQHGAGRRGGRRRLLRRRLRVVGPAREVVTEFDDHNYLDHFSEAVEEWSYLKFPFLKDLGRGEGSVRVGSLARLNVTRHLTTPLADAELQRFHAYSDGMANARTLHGNWARAIEVLHAAEVVARPAARPRPAGDRPGGGPRAADAWTGEGIGVVEAPRGTLIHHYRADEDGAITAANLIVATTQNNEVLNRTVRAVAEQELSGRAEITEGMMNAIEVGIRAYDPCLSCATHALGQMPLVVSVHDAAGALVAERVRG